MWLLTWTTYKASKLATFVSVIGALTRYAGVLCIVNGAGIVPTLICFGIGVLIHFGAEELGFRGWVKVVRKEGLEEMVRRGNVEIARELYKIKPENRTKRYLASVNSEVVSQLKI